MKSMTCKERVVSAAKYQEVDHVPMIMEFLEPYIVDPVTKIKRVWTNEQERLAIYRDLGWDTNIYMFLTVTPGKEVTTEAKYEQTAERTILHQIWNTPAGTIEEKLHVTEDWLDALPETSGDCYRNPISMGGKLNAPDRTGIIGFSSDFRPTRYVEPPFKDSKDLDTLEYLFPLKNPIDEELIFLDYQYKKALSDEFDVPLIIYGDLGMDWLAWISKQEAFIWQLIETPDETKKILDIINAAKRQRMQMLLDLGVDGVVRRGFYESTDFWNPAIFRDFAMPELRHEIEMTHAVGGIYTYMMISGVMALLPDLENMPFDCLWGVEPVLGVEDQRKVRESLPGKAMFGGISGPAHLELGTPEHTVQGVEEAFEIMGKSGFILGPRSMFRPHWSWENLAAFEGAWKRLR